MKEHKMPVDCGHSLRQLMTTNKH